MITTRVLQVKDISKTFTQSKGLFGRQSVDFFAVKNVSFDIDFNDPDFLTIAGESGSGKTTIARLILRLIKPVSGSITYNGQNIWTMNRKDLQHYRMKVQAVFQDPFAAFNPIYKVDHLLRRTIKNFGLAESQSDTEKLLAESLEIMRLRPEILDKYPRALSGGERQRIMLARAILPHPDLIIADEPVSMLDTTIRIGVLEEMLKVKERLGISFVYITHDLATAAYIGGNVLIMFQGMATEMGQIKQVLQKPMHPYTRLLVNSIPQLNPEKREEFFNLQKMESQESGRVRQNESQSCPFRNRCSEYSEKCTPETPPLIKVGAIAPTRWVRCHNYT
jgi:peptide/nickel transport system ATP-binding protein